MNISKHKTSIIILIIAITSCSSSKQSVKKDSVAQNEVAFLEYYQTQAGEVLSGTMQQGRRIDGPTYRFDPATKELKLLRKENFSIDSITVLLGNGKVLKGTSGSGLSMRINAIGKLPYTMSNLTITMVSRKGIYFIFEKKKLLLKEGEEWRTSKVSIDTIQLDPLAIVKTTTTHTIQYHGMLDKKRVVQ